MPNDDVKTLREAAFACTIRYANTHMSTNDRLYFDAIKICFNRMADMIEREDGDLWTKKMVDERDQVIADNAWNAALQAGIDYVKEIVGDVATEKLNAFEVYAALNSLRREPRT